MLSGIVIFPFLVSCPPLTAPDNGMIDCTGSLFEDTCTFSCEADYNITGSESRTCQSDRTWSGSEAMCTRGMLLLYANKWSVSVIRTKLQLCSCI